MEAVCDEAGRRCIGNKFSASGKLLHLLGGVCTITFTCSKTERFVFVSAVRLHEYDGNAPENGGFEIEGLSGGFKTGTWKNAGVDSKNEYFREYEYGCQLIVM